MDNLDNDRPKKQKDGRKVSQYAVAYNQMRPFWDDALTLKEPLPFGNSTTSARFLRKYAKEDEGEFGERVKRLAQVNFIDLIVDSYCSMLFSTNVQIKSQNNTDEVDRFVGCCNPQGDTLLEYFREAVAPSVLTYGVSDVFVDLPRVDGQVESVEQQQAAGLDAPYVYTVPPLNRVYWELDDAGQYREYQSSDIIDTQIDGGRGLNDRQQYTIWTLNDVTLYDNNGNTIDTRPNPFGMIPAITVISRYPLRYHKDRMGLSLVQDVIPMQKLVLNLMSLILDFHESVNFGQRVIIQDTDQADDAPTEGELSEGGNKRGVILKGKGSQYQIVTPDSGGVESMRVFLAEIIDRIYQSVSLSSDSNTVKTHQTQGTIRSNQAVLFNKLSKIVKHFEKALKQIVEMALKVQGIDPVKAKVTVQWDKNFSYEAFSATLEQLAMLRQSASDISPTAVREYAKAVISPQLYNSPKIEQIEAEIDEWVPPVTPPPPPGGAVNFETQNQQVNAAQKVADSDQQTN